MPRKPRIILPGFAHHITQRGNNRKKVFGTEQDFRNYCYWINHYAKQYEIDIVAYCLMNNHVHFIVVPRQKESVASFFNTVHMRYTQYFNKKNNACGHLWQGRFFSCILDQEHLYYAVRYVEQNPVRAGMVKYPWDYHWSSARWHTGKQHHEKYIFVKELLKMDKKFWKEYLLSENRDFIKRIRQDTKTGVAVASESFIEQWEKKLNCILRRRKAGRPKKEE